MTAGAGMTLREPLLIAEFWANRRGESIRVQLREYEGQALIDIRKHYTGREGKLLPTKKGLSVAVRRLPDLAAAIAKAERTARALGLIKPEGSNWKQLGEVATRVLDKSVQP